MTNQSREETLRGEIERCKEQLELDYFLSDETLDYYLDRMKKAIDELNNL